MNKKLIIYLSFVLLCSTGITSCYKDKGNYSYEKLPALYVDTAGTGALVIKQFATVKLSPKLVYDGAENDLQFMWRLYLTTGAGTIDTLSQQKNLDHVINLVPGSYYLELRAVHKTNGLMALQQYPLTIEASYPYGWMVAYEKDGATDVDLICATDFMGTLSKDSVYRQLYYQTNNKHLAGLPVTIAQPGIYGTQKRDRIYLLTSAGGARLSYLDFSELQSYSQIFNQAPAVLKPEGYGGAFGYEMIVNDGGVYFTGTNSANTFGIRAIEKVKDYRASPYTTRPTGALVGVFYDQQNMRFLSLAQYTNEVANYTKPTVVEAMFDLSNIGKQMLFMEQGFGQAANADPYRYAFFKDVSGNGRYLYAINFQTASTNPAMMKLDLTNCPGIANAAYFATGNLGPFSYYTTGNQVYRLRYDVSSNTLTGTDLFYNQIGAGEQITAMKLFKATGSGTATSMSNRLLFIATWNETAKTGKVYMLHINEASGQLEGTDKVYTGFGKIADMAPKVY